MWVQYIGIEFHGSNIVKKYRHAKNGYKLHRDFCGCYKKIYYLANKATEADQRLKTLEYRGDRTRFNIEGYYKSLTEAFTDLEHNRPPHEINENQRVLKFENGDKKKWVWCLTSSWTYFW